MTPLGLEATRLPERAEQGWEALTCGRGGLTATAGARGPGRRNSRRVMPRSGGRAAPEAGKGDARAPGAGLAARLLLRAGPGGRGLSRQLVGLRKRSSWRKKRGSWAAPRVQQRHSPHGAQRALLDHRTPSTARAWRVWGRGGRGPRGVESPLAAVTLGRPRGRSTRLPISDPGRGRRKPKRAGCRRPWLLPCVASAPGLASEGRTVSPCRSHELRSHSPPLRGLPSTA